MSEAGEGTTRQLLSPPTLGRLSPDYTVRAETFADYPKPGDLIQIKKTKSIPDGKEKTIMTLTVASLGIRRIPLIALCVLDGNTWSIPNTVEESDSIQRIDGVPFADYFNDVSRGVSLKYEYRPPSDADLLDICKCITKAEQADAFRSVIHGARERINADVQVSDNQQSGVFKKMDNLLSLLSAAEHDVNVNRLINQLFRNVRL